MTSHLNSLYITEPRQITLEIQVSIVRIEPDWSFSSIINWIIFLWSKVSSFYHGHMVTMGYEVKKYLMYVEMWIYNIDKIFPFLSEAFDTFSLTKY